MPLTTLPLVGFVFYPFFKGRKDALKTFILSSIFQIYFLLSNYVLFLLLEVLPYLLEKPIEVVFYANHAFITFCFLYLNYLIKADKLNSFYRRRKYLSRFAKILA